MIGFRATGRSVEISLHPGREHLSFRVYARWRQVFSI
jgi:hypothetical protein